MKLKPYASSDDGERGYSFWCPACAGRHHYRTQAPNFPRPDGTPWPVWSFNGDMERPTFLPSLLIYYDPGHWGDDGKWVVTGPRKTICHLHLKNGQLEYCNDNPHAMNNLVVPLPDIPQRAVVEPD